MIQKVKVAFLTDLNNNIKIELIEPIGEQSPVFKTCQNGGGLVNKCYQVEDIEKACLELQEKGVKLICPPVPGAGHGNARVAFFIQGRIAQRTHF